MNRFFVFGWILLSTILLRPFIASAQTTYRIVEIGATGPEHTRADGYQSSLPSHLNAAGQVAGMSDRFLNSGAEGGSTAWLYTGGQTINIGLTDSPHTASNGFRSSYTTRLTSAGHVYGGSSRYGGSTYLGDSVWYYNGVSTELIGLIDSAHTNANGYQDNAIRFITDTGFAVGSARRFDSSFPGTSAWIYDGAASRQIGLVDSEHTRQDGFQLNGSAGLNDSGQVIGNANRYDGSTGLGQSAWFYDGTHSQNIGLLDQEHTRADGYRYSQVSRLNHNGTVLGTSRRYNGSADAGVSAWLHDDGETFEIGLTGPEFVRADGYRETSIGSLNEAGKATGSSTRFSVGDETHLQAWLYSQGTTTPLGLADTEHTRADGLRESSAGILNQTGQVLGNSSRFAGGVQGLGRSAWLYDGTSYTRLGLTGPEHTRADGYQSSQGTGLNEAGQTIGIAERFHEGNFAAGQSAWFADGTTTVELGLTGGVFTGNSGYEFSEAQQLTDSGVVRGYSLRFDGYNDLGRTAWVFDSITGVVPVLLSERSDGYSYSEVRYLSPDGIALGLYQVYDGMTSLGARAFYWSPLEGLHDLGELVEGGLDASGWTALLLSNQANESGQITGIGSRIGAPSGSNSAFLMTPVPEPSSSTLVVLGLSGLMVFWRKRALVRLR